MHKRLVGRGVSGGERMSERLSQSGNTGEAVRAREEQEGIK